MNKCSILNKVFARTGMKDQCPNEATHWVTIGKLGDMDGQTVWLCKIHVDMIYQWKFED